MKIGIIQASSQKDKNKLLYECVKKAVNNKKDEVINFGVYDYETITYSYVQIAFLISLLLESKAVDFVITGCTSGQGMMLACNSMPHILCGYIENPADAFLFGRINNGNAVSLPLGLNFGWAGEIQLQSTLHSLFDGAFGIGYPEKDAQRKQIDTKLMKEINLITKKSMIEIMPFLDSEFIKSSLMKRNVYDYILKFGNDNKLISSLKRYD